MRENPATVLSLLYRRKEKVDIRANPTVESVSVLTEVLRSRISDNLRIREPIRALLDS